MQIKIANIFAIFYIVLHFLFFIINSHKRQKKNRKIAKKIRDYSMDDKEKEEIFPHHSHSHNHNHHHQNQYDNNDRYDQKRVVKKRRKIHYYQNHDAFEQFDSIDRCRPLPSIRSRSSMTKEQKRNPILKKREKKKLLYFHFFFFFVSLLSRRILYRISI